MENNYNPDSDYIPPMEASITITNSGSSDFSNLINSSAITINKSHTEVLANLSISFYHGLSKKIIDNHHNITVENSDVKQLFKNYENIVFEKMVEQNETINNLKKEVAELKQIVNDLSKKIKMSS